MKRIEHQTKPDRSTCEMVAIVVLERRRDKWDRKKLRAVTEALRQGYRFDERGMPMEECNEQA